MRHRTITTENGTVVPFERIELNMAALMAAADHYAEATGSVDELELASAIEVYLEASES